MPISSRPQRFVSQTAIPRSVRLGAGFALIVVAGFVDAVGYIELGGFFASFMSGASISFGVSISGSEWGAASQAALLVAVFVVAATIASIVSGAMRPWGIPTALLLEALCLSGAIVMLENGYPPFQIIFPVVAAMGIQNTALQPIHGVRLGVTFMTGTLVSLSQTFGRHLIGRARPWSWTPHALSWLLFVAGAAGGAISHGRFGFSAIMIATGVVWVLVGTTFLFAFAEVRKQRRKAILDRADT